MFVERSQALGASTFWILRKQILPNVLPLIFANTVLIVAALDPLRVDALVPRPRRHRRTRRGARCSNAPTSRAPSSAGAWWYFLPPGTLHLPPRAGLHARRATRSRRSSTRASGSAAMTMADRARRPTCRATSCSTCATWPSPTATRPARRSAWSTASRSSSAAARRSGWPASRAAARPRPRSRCSACCPTNLYRAEGRSYINSTAGRSCTIHKRTERGLRDLRWNADLDGLPGRDERARSRDARVRPDRRGDPAARAGRRPEGRRRPHRGAVRLRRHQPGPGAPVPARVLRRHAPARDDRARPGLQPGADHRRRADDGARRDDAGADPRAARGAARASSGSR